LNIGFYILGKETKAEAKVRYEKEMSIQKNAKEQVSALLSFKEALSTGPTIRYSFGCLNHL
jgi:hypothetical protein